MELSVERFPGWLRWLFLPVVSIVAYFVISIAVSLVGRIIVFLGSTRGGWSENFFDYLVSPGVAGFYAVSAGGFVAPRAKQLTSTAIAGIWICMAGAATFFVVLDGNWKFVLYIAALVVGTVYAAINQEG